MLVELWVGPAVGSKCHGGAVLNDGPTSNVDVEGREGGGVDPQLLTGYYKHTLSTTLNEHRAGHRTTQHSAHTATSYNS